MYKVVLIKPSRMEGGRAIIELNKPYETIAIVKEYRDKQGRRCTRYLLYATILKWLRPLVSRW